LCTNNHHNQNHRHSFLFASTGTATEFVREVARDAMDQEFSLTEAFDSDAQAVIEYSSESA
jgi:hypothetical protein